MPTASLIIEALRAYPVVAFWLAVLAQATIWVLFPAITFDSPPGDLAEVLAIGREWQWGSWRGPPLAFWAAELAWRAAGGHIAGVYILAQACIITAFWAMFTIGRAMVGAPQAALAVYLMVGVLAFTLPTPVFGPNVLAVALTALALLALWRAVGERRRNAWGMLGFIIGLLLLTSYWGLLLFALIPVFLLVIPEGRRVLLDLDPWIGAVLALLIAMPHAIWMREAGWFAAADPRDWVAGDFGQRLIVHAPLMLAGLAALNAGLIGLVVLARRRWAPRHGAAPQIEGLPRRPLARDFVVFFAVTPALMAVLAATALGTGGGADWAAPLLLVPALALVVGGGQKITVHRQQAVTTAWLGALLLPPVMLLAVIVAAPFTAAFNAEVDEPAAAMGAAFAEAHLERAGRPLEFVIGDARTAHVVALAAPERPRVQSAIDPRRTPWVSDADIRASGAIAVWPLDGRSGEGPPAELRRRYPALQVEPPREFRLAGGGHAPVLRIGWAFLPPEPQPRDAIISPAE